MSINFSTLQGLTIPEGAVTQIADASGRVLWMLSGGDTVILEVEKITSDTYAGETTYTGEQFILLDIYPKTNGTVKITYGGLTKTITDTSGAAEPNAQQVFFGTFNGVPDSVTTPANGTLTIEGDYRGVACSTFKASKLSSPLCSCVTAISDLGNSEFIPDLAFGAALSESCTKITKVKIPSSVRSIGSSAFLSCTGLTSVTIAEGVTSIGNNAFQNCTGLMSVTIPSSVTSIGNSAFAGCTGLTSVTIPSSVTSIGTNPWQGCFENNAITVASGNTAYNIDGNCLIEIASNTIIAGYADATIPSSVTSIGNSAFAGCTGLTSVTIPSSVTSIGSSAFLSCTGLTSVTIAEGVTSIGSNAFLSCTGLTSITIPSGVTSIGIGTFSGCTGLASITIPSSVRSIGNSAFQNCTGLMSVTIPSSVTSIGNSAFAGCTGLTSVSFVNTSGWYVSTSSTATSGTAVDVSNPVNNVTLLTTTYSTYYWHRS